MKSVDFLYVALTATAVIHMSYLAILWRKWTKVRERRREVEEE